MLHKHTLVAFLIAANLVATSIAKSAWAMPNDTLPHDPAEQRVVMEELIRLYFPPESAERMIIVANCESGGMHLREQRDLVPNQVGSSARGALQILMSVHEAPARARGLDIRNNVSHYLQYARFLYEFDRRRGGNGLRPWNETRSCWNRPQPNQRAMVVRDRTPARLMLAEAR